MKQTADFHMHTVFCDGKNTPEEMVLRGIELGFSVMGFSVHSPLWEDCPWTISKSRLSDYRREIERLREKYADRIRIYCGIEKDYLTDFPTDDFDYVIGSVHYVCAGYEKIEVDHSAEIALEGIERYFGGDIYAYAEEYFRTVGEIVEKTNADLIGHFDLLTKFCDCGLAFDTSHPRYVAAWQAAADKLLKTGVPFEINTGAISRGYRSTPYPALDIMRYLAEHGGTAVITGDCHSAKALGTAYEEAYALAKEAGLPLVNRVRNISF
ncbi:MAG: histidinol-phosphatase [Clostridia bacterium]|nr:histidinol-phosphatase [Clostridia bacterium]